ncbi:ectoine/hydroxyectoine ABC transporter substrate-binding protein EhuB [Halomonas rhizosphaerae]|uniref:Ectoine/hydroxyectoine ABC transporter substrate-binding protein EhuB n=1 Tax=Halomonas rhizosphaerae TaxID=3043296 RepID=A0ABT6V3C6_9GAMM|nr:ectoine/hydroxyectoine ABC transporter substrate-binding protein EhuB [Halomonas rhizosphaerae]MDI5891412.1 ectoine/hydroxyectoine ABC transporter substrate-binding protein EhuB [Halomonas rhizosphaerae]MDI5921751.1 ectoine/hydroxyectoine ABC transporter substrate-binding protein EhuB [Halomonas rhizosphaerae]
MASALATLLAIPGLQADTLKEIQQRGVIRIAVANEKPYGYLNEQGEPLGVGPEVARRILDDLGIEEIEWVETEFKNLIPGLEVGRFDMAAAEMAIMPERCARVLFSDPNTSYGEGLLVLASNPNRIRAYEDFIERPDTIRVAVQEGTVTQDMFNALGIDPDRIITVERHQDAIEAIVRGRADAFAATGMTVASMEQMSPQVEAEFNFTDPVIDGREVRYFGGFAFPLDAEDLRDAVNEALLEEKRNGDWQQTLTRYGFLQKDVLYSYRFSADQLCNGIG